MNFTGRANPYRSWRAIILFLLVLQAEPVWTAHATDYKDSAYIALRAVSKRFGRDSINHIVEVRGRHGVPQPDVWIVVLQEAKSGGRLRELSVKNGAIISEKRLAAKEAATTIVLEDLNLDSSGAFDAIDSMARRVHVPFDSLDFLLQNGAVGKGPVWTVELFEKGVRAGTVQFTARDGKVAHQTFTSGVSDTASNNRDDDDLTTIVFDDADDFFARVGARFKQPSNQLDNFITGKTAPGEPRQEH